MLFNSISFLFFFLPISLVFFFVLGRIQKKLATAWLGLISIVFYNWLGTQFLIILCGSILFNYILGYLIQKNVAKDRLALILLIVGITINLSVLGYYKYFLDLTLWLKDLGLMPGPAIGSSVLPLGISFFTFTQIGYLIDSKASITKNYNFVDYVLFVTFFPHLIAGPILHHKEIMPQFANDSTYRINVTNLTVGFSIFTLGLAKKVLIADQFIPFVTQLFNNTHELTRTEAWCGVLSYYIQIYFDFSGYSEMAMGLAKMFNIRFPANFDSPYKASNIIDFWQRWHMSLTRYLTLYLYNPIAISITRYRIQKKLSIATGKKDFSALFTITLIPTFITMLLAGIWHGSGIQFVIYGLLHGWYLSINHVFKAYFPAKKTTSSQFIHWFDKLWKIILTNLAVMVAFIFFRANTPEEAFNILKSMTFDSAQANFHSLNLGPIETYLDLSNAFFHKAMIGLSSWHAGNAISIFCALWIIFMMPNMLQLFSEYEPALAHAKAKPALLNFKWQPNIAWGLIMAITCLLSVLSVTGTTEFLYFRF